MPHARDISPARASTDLRELLLRFTLRKIEALLRRRMDVSAYGHVGLQLDWRAGAINTLRIVDPTQIIRAEDLDRAVHVDAAGDDELAGIERE